MDHDHATTQWRKSSYSNSGANCVEVAQTRGGEVAVRDSKNPGGPELTFTQDTWHAFVRNMKATG